jgi:hypothetical protein
MSGGRPRSEVRQAQRPHESENDPQTTH